MFKVAIDAGHSMNTPGKRTPDGEREWFFNDIVVDAFINELNSYSDVSIKRVDDPTGKTDISLNTRTNTANSWGADVYISVHHNANTGNWGAWTGTETFTYTGSQPKSEKLANAIHPLIVKAVGLRNRGLKKANFHVLRETKMAAILIEIGYMDSTIDIKKLRNTSVLKAAGVAIATGLANYAGLKKKSGTSTIQKPSNPTPQLSTNPGQIGIATILTPTVIRKGPGASYALVRHIEKGEIYRVYESKNGWYNLGGDQWIIASYVKYTQVATPVSNDTYKVVAGDTLWSVSQKVSMSVEEIKSLNGLTSNVISVGQVLKVKKK